MNQGRILLICAGVLSSFFAALHIVVIFIGAPAYRYFGAGEEMAVMDQSAIITTIYLLRGIGAISDAVMLIENPNYPIRALIFSLISLLAGLLYLLGLKKHWNNLRTPNWIFWDLK